MPLIALVLENIENNPFEQIQKFFEDFKGDINIIDEQIDINLQMEYFDVSKSIRSKNLVLNWENCSHDLYDNLKTLNDKKEILVQLAAIEDVKAYRVIETFSENAPENLKHWSLLALQESRMLLQSKLLEQSQVLISTGLGGKGNKLRYFFALFSTDDMPFVEYQQKIMRNEFDAIFKKNNSEIEEFYFHNSIATVLGLVPLNVPVQELFAKVLQEVNQYGNFLRENCIITNVRKMSEEEIYAFIKNNS